MNLICVVSDTFIAPSVRTLHEFALFILINREEMGAKLIAVESIYRAGVGLGCT